MADGPACKTVLTAWQERKREEIEHLFLKERTPLSLPPHLQASPLPACCVATSTPIRPWSGNSGYWF